MNNAVTCATGCASALTSVDPSKCSPVLNPGQIQRLALTDLLATGTNFGAYDATETPAAGAVNLPASWSARIDQTYSGTNDVILLHVIGEKARPEDTEQEISLGRKRVTDREHTVQFSVDETSDMIHDFFRKVSECGWTGGVWYETSGPLLFGNTLGIHIPIVASIKAGMVIPRETGSLITWEGEITWKAMGTETRIPSPIPATPEPA